MSPLRDRLIAYLNSPATDIEVLHPIHRITTMNVESLADSLLPFIQEELDDLREELTRPPEPPPGSVTCPVCQRVIRVNTNGKMAMHNNPSARESCAGTGLTVTQAKPGMTTAESMAIRYPRWHRYTGNY